MRDGIVLVRDQPAQRLRIITDFYRLLLDGLEMNIVLLCIYLCIPRNRNTSKLSEWIASLYGERRNSTCNRRCHCEWDRSPSNSLFITIFYRLHPYFFVLSFTAKRSTIAVIRIILMQKVTLLLSTVIVIECGLDTKDREEVTRDMIGNILRMVMVYFLSFFFFLSFLNLILG